MWFYAKGKPVERVEPSGPEALAHLSDEELRLQLLDAVKSLTPAK